MEDEGAVETPPMEVWRVQQEVLRGWQEVDVKADAVGRDHERVQAVSVPDHGVEDGLPRLQLRRLHGPVFAREPVDGDVSQLDHPVVRTVRREELDELMVVALDDQLRDRIEL